MIDHRLTIPCLAASLTVFLGLGCGPSTSENETDTGDSPSRDTRTVVDADADTATDADTAVRSDTADADGGDADVQTCSNPSIWYRDRDMDGYGTEDATTMACGQPEGYVDQKGDCDDSNASAHPDGTEMCDDLDNDCDGDTDEMLVEDCSKQEGICSGATTTCRNGIYVPCSGDEYGSDYEEGDEVSCDGIDNDCDGDTDEGLTQSCSNQTGVCSGSSSSCANGSFPSCSASDYGSDYESDESTCDGLDNDCDGQTDEDLGDQNCSLQTGVCSGAAVSCQNGAYPTCGADEYGSEYEANDERSCDGLDNDCDGQTDENVTQQCPKQKGVCSGATVTCQNQSFPKCTASDYGPDYESTESSCDGLDNDCDGQTDRLPDCTYRAILSGSPAAAVVAIELNETTGDVFLAGVEGDVLARSPTSQDIFVAKYDDRGIRQWRKKVSTSGTDTVNDLAVDETNNRVYVAGGVEGSVGGESISGTADAIIATYDFSGTRQNVQLIGTSGVDRATGVSLDSTDDRIDVVGYTDDAFSGQTNAGSFDVFVFEYDLNWNRQWSDQFGSASADIARSATVDTSTGAVYLGGFTRGSVSSGTSNQGARDTFTAKYDTSGTQQWIRQSGSSSAELIARVAVDESTGALYAAGRTRGALQGISHSGLDDAFVMKRGSSGSFQWIEATGGTDNDGWESVQFDQDSDKLVTSGYSNGAPGSTTNTGGFDAMAAAYETDGTQNWLELRGTSNLENGVAIETDSTSTDLYQGGIWDYDDVNSEGDAFLSRIR